MQSALSCLAAAAVGSLLTLLAYEHRDAGAVAQDANPAAPPAIPLPTAAEVEPPAATPANPLGGYEALPAPKADAPEGEIRLSEEERIAVEVYERTNRGVVHITTQQFESDFFLRAEHADGGSGSGAILDKKGRILTNWHVVEDADEVQVTLYDGTHYEATLVGGDPLNDLAVLQIQAPARLLEPMTLADSSRLRVGMRVFAIGNPFGLERTMTTGIISSLNRSLNMKSIRSIRSIIQIDANINPGNSGGPLLNSRGEVIGINVAIASTTGQSAGVGFAIPANTVRRLVPELIENGRLIHPEHGITHVWETPRGLLIRRLDPKGPAAKAGLNGPKVREQQRGGLTYRTVDRSEADLIVAADRIPIRTPDDFLTYMESREAGDRVVLTIVRDGEELQVPIVLEDGE